MIILNVTLKNLEWAAANIEMPLNIVVSKITSSPKNQSRILEGSLTIKEAEKFSQITKIPFGYLFLDNPPKSERIIIPDLRQKPNPEPLSENFHDVLKDIKFKHEWYLEYIKEIEVEPLNFVGKFDNNASYKDIAVDICDVLDLPINPKSRKEREGYFTSLIERCEQARILVFRSGVVGSNNKKILDIDEFRGFVLTHKFAPAIFINLQDSPSARIFTLIHELAHIWLGQNGIDDLHIDAKDDIEILCNRVAAEVLVPQKVFKRKWDELEGNISDLSDYFGVSEIVIARVALTLSYMSKSEYIDNYHRDQFIDRNKRSQINGGDYYRNALGKNTLALSRAVFNKAMSGGITLREAGKVLGMNPQSVMVLGENYI
ncbi:hypothetical protein DCO44_03040 [Acinetobacter sp. AM]|nr:hypothetical protein DCO44_03040 [Acinetobacter sp. AM]